MAKKEKRIKPITGMPILGIDEDGNLNIDINAAKKAYNKQNKLIYLAVNCNSKKINTATSTSKWRGWFSPKKRFESNLISELCNDSSAKNLLD